jgi:large subunit ribosomal protein L6
MKIDHIEEKITLTDGVKASINGRNVTVEGPKGKVERSFGVLTIDFKIEGNELVVFSDNATKSEKKLVRTYFKHLMNMVKGVTEGITYKLKICSGHFPMSVSCKNNMFEVKNLFGETVPRRLAIKDGANVKVNGQDITVDGVDKELVAQTAAAIEKLTRRCNFDRRIFQDGIYIVEKNGKQV